MNLPERVHALHASFNAGGIPHAFGGALALAYCIAEPRGTRDIDVNCFVAPSGWERVLAALPGGVEPTAVERKTLARDGQVRVMWDDTPIDLFLDVADFHAEAGARVRVVPLTGADIPVLDCASLAVFKAMFNRTKDWADLETMVEARTFDSSYVLGWLTRLMGPGDERVLRLLSLIDEASD